MTAAHGRRRGYRLVLAGGPQDVELTLERAAGAAAGDAHAHARLRRGLVDAPDLDRRPAGRAGPARRRGRSARAARRVAAARGRAAPGDARRRPGRRLALAARAAGRRRGPAAGPRLPGADHRPRAARACTTRSGSGRSSSAHESALRRLAAAPARAPRARWRWPPGRCCRRCSSAAPSGSCCGWSAPSCCTMPLLWPAYTTLDRLARRGRPAGWANYVRVPVGISALLLLVFFPVMCGKGERDVHARERRRRGRATRGAGCSSARCCSPAAGVLYLVRSRSGSSS